MSDRIRGMITGFQNLLEDIYRERFRRNPQVENESPPSPLMVRANNLRSPELPAFRDELKSITAKVKLEEIRQVRLIK